MFGSDENKKSRKPVKGYRWMFFTFFMVFILSLIVIFQKDFEDIKSSIVRKTGEAVKNAGNNIFGSNDNKSDANNGNASNDGGN